MTEFDIYLEDEVRKLEDERRTALAEKGFAPFLEFREGTFDLEFPEVVPKASSLFSNKVTFRVRKDGLEFDWTVNRNNPLYSKIIHNLHRGIRKMRVTRTGTTKEDTKYEVQAGGQIEE